MSTNPQTPKTQYEIATGKQKEFNRGKIASRKTDEVKDFTVTIRDIDFAIKYYFQNVIKPRVIENNNVVDVPIIYANPERWKSIQKDGYWKDGKDKIILPVIVFKRNSISKDENYVVDKLDANNPVLFYPFKKKWSDKNRYDNFNVQIGITPTEEYYSVVVPDYVVMNYEFVIMTEAVDQMNKIVEAIIYSEGSYWGERERFKFRTKIQSYNTNIETGMDLQRNVKTTFTMDLNGYLVPDTINKQLPLVAGNFEKAFSPKQVFWGFDVDQASEFFSPSVKEAQPTITNVQGGVTSIEIQYVATGSIAQYLATSVPRTATAVTSNSATFSNVNILQAPAGSGLTTTKENFSVFVNGQYINNNFVISILDDISNTVVVTIDSSSLGFGLDSSDVVEAIGKFSVI